MSKINNNEEKQNINNIKNLYKLSTDGVVPSLFHEVKKAKQQIFSLASMYKEKLSNLVQEEASKMPLKQEEKPEIKDTCVTKEQPQLINKKEETPPIVETADKSMAEKNNLVKKTQEEDKPSQNQPSQNQINQTQNQQNQFQKNPENQNKPRQFTPNYDRQRSFNNNQNYNNQNYNNQGYSNRSYNNQNNTNSNFNNQNYNNRNTNSNFNNQNYNNRNTNQNYNNRNYTNQNSNNQSSTNQSSITPNNNFRNNNFNKPFNNQERRPFNPNFQRTNAPYQNRPFQNSAGSSNFQGQRRPYDSRPNFANNSPNKSLISIIPRKTTNLTSAASAFGTAKERNFSNKKKTNVRDDERRINKKSLLRRGLVEEQSIEERMVTRKLRLKKQKQEMTPMQYLPVNQAIITTPNLTVKILSEKIGKTATEIIKQFMLLGIMTTINSTIDFETAELVANELGIKLELKIEKSFEEKLKEKAKTNDENCKENRAPIVTIVGHVDHGKTSLLDYIRKTHVTANEAGGITQSIGAYSIVWKGENITFIDTPGHEAFMNMRKRGTEITDIAILVIAGDDGIKPQTIEAIKHVKQAKVPMIVAITKIDKSDANIERIKQQLTEQDVLPEEWGGDAIIVPVSSVTGEGIDKLLEIILLVSEMQNLKCNKKQNAVGTIIEAQLDKNKGPVANVIIQNGTLKLGDNVVSGFALGRVRAMIDDKGKNISKAGPSTPVSILGFDNVPNAGDSIQVVDEKFSKNVIQERKIKMAQQKIENGVPKSLNEFLATPISEDKKVLNLVLKASSQGTVEALKESLIQVYNDEVKVEVVYSGVGNLTENDVQLAKVSNALIVAFEIKILNKISNYAKQNKVEILEFNIIYKAIEEMQNRIKLMLSPKFEEKVVGHAEVRALFKISSLGTIAGCYITDGKFVRNSSVKILRNDLSIFEGKVSTLKREKDEVKEVAQGFECGIKIDNFNDILVGDILECVVKQQIN